MSKKKIILIAVVWLVTLVISIGGGFLGAKIYIAKNVKISYSIIRNSKRQNAFHYFNSRPGILKKSVVSDNSTDVINHNSIAGNKAKNYDNGDNKILAKEDYKFGKYVNKIVSIIRSHFHVSKDFFKYNDVIAFQISKTGRIYGVKVMKSSGNKLYDARAIEAVKSSTPLPAPPKGFMNFINYSNENNGVLVIFNPQAMEKANG